MRNIESQPITEDEFNKSGEIMQEVEKVDEIGYYIINGLPTSCKLYPEGTIIKARPLKVLEVKMLSQMDDETADDVVNDILNKVVIGINIDELYTPDKLYIIFWLRANTYKDSNFGMDFKCPLCAKNSSYDFEIDNLKLRSFNDESLKDFQDGFSIGDTKITIGLMTIKDEKDNKRFLRDNERSLMNFDEEILAICKMIKTINGKKLGMIEKYMYLTEDLNPAQYAIIESYLEDKRVGVEPMMNVVCKECGGSTETVLPFRPDFFLPKVHSRRNS